MTADDYIYNGTTRRFPACNATELKAEMIVLLSFIPRSLRNVTSRFLLALILTLLGACAPSLRISDKTPPLILAPASSAGVTDDRGRFREVLCTIYRARGEEKGLPCAKLLHRLEREPAPTGRPVSLGPAQVKLRIRIVPGIFGECVNNMATPFLDAIRPIAGRGYALSSLGFDVAAFSVSGRSSSANNAEEIRKQIDAMELKSDERLVLVGYSKGMSDILELIGNDRSVVPLGSAIVSLTGVVAGTPIADQAESAHNAIGWIPFPGCPVGDRGGVTSLTRHHRLGFLASHPLPKDLKYYSIPAYTNRKNISSFLKSSNASLSKIDARNDGNVIFYDSVIPGSKLLGYLNADHWAVAIPFEIYAPKRAKIFASRNHFPRVVVLEAIARMIEESYLDDE